MEAEFEVIINETDVINFAEISGDWNPLHTDSEYAKDTTFRRKIVHGAYSAGLISRMAGMHLPGESCLLHKLNMRFINPIFMPVSLLVKGKIIKEWKSGGQAEVIISDIKTSARYVEGSYEFSHHQKSKLKQESVAKIARTTDSIMVTGASGGLGSTLLKRLGGRGFGVSHSDIKDITRSLDGERLNNIIGAQQIGAIVHCGWPTPDNQRLCELNSETEQAISYHLAEPLSQAINLAQLIALKGSASSALVLVGSTFAKPGRHAYRSPLYSLAKSMIPTLTKILAVELAAKQIKCVGVVFDVIEGPGMNFGINETARLMHADRSPFGNLATTNEAAAQIEWILSNQSSLISGATICLTGGSLP